MTKTARVFAESVTHNDNIFTYCCDGLHVREHWHWFGPSLKQRSVSICDGSCSEKSTLRQQEFSRKDVSFLRALLSA